MILIATRVSCPPHSPPKTLAGMVEAFDTNYIVGVREEPRLTEQQFGNFQNLATIVNSKAERARFGRFYYRYVEMQVETHSITHTIFWRQDFASFLVFLFFFILHPPLSGLPFLISSLSVGECFHLTLPLGLTHSPRLYLLLLWARHRLTYETSNHFAHTNSSGFHM